MKERTFNIFMYVNGPERIIRTIGIVEHQQEGTDEQKIAFLQSRVNEEFGSATKHQMPSFAFVVWSGGEEERGVMRWDYFCELQKKNLHMHILEPIFNELKAPLIPLMVITPIVDGVPTVEGFIHLHPMGGA